MNLFLTCNSSGKYTFWSSKVALFGKYGVGHPVIITFPLAARHESEPTPLFWVAVVAIFATSTHIALLVKCLQGKTLLVCEAKSKLSNSLVNSLH